MRILHIISQKPDETGSGIFAKNLLRIGSIKGYEQALIAGISSKDKKLEGVYGDTAFYKVVFDTEALPFPVPGMSDVMPYESTKYKDMNLHMLQAWKNAFKDAVIQAVENFKPQIIISHHLWILTAMVRELLPEIPIIAICHGTDLRQLDYAVDYSNYVINGVRNIDKIIALSHHQREIIAEKYGVQMDKIFVTGGGYDETIFYPIEDKPKTKPVNIIYAGKLSFAKGVNSLIKALSLLTYGKDEINLVLAGSGSGAQEESIKILAQSCPYNVGFLGKVDQKTLAQAFRESHIFVLPSFYEGLSLVVIEALASNLRVVTNDLPGMQQWMGKDIAESGALSFVKLPLMEGIDKPLENELPDYERRLASALIGQIDEVKFVNPISVDVAEIIRRKFSWEAVFAKIEDVIRSISSTYR